MSLCRPAVRIIAFQTTNMGLIPTSANAKILKIFNTCFTKKHKAMKMAGVEPKTFGGNARTSDHWAKYPFTLGLGGST